MLLTITYRGPRATELGYLLHKNPARAQRFELTYGCAYVFYPVAEENECTAALLVDLNPIDLARGKLGSSEGGLFDYVNDRPYAASSFMSSALSKVFSTAMSGRCEKLPELAARPLELEARVTMLPCRGDDGFVKRVFEPLGYEVSFESFALDEKFPGWGQSDYINLTLRGTVRLCELLNHLYVLIPVFDRQKHYWMSGDEVEKLLRHGEGWLGSHPEMELIARRYFYRKGSLANLAIERLLDDSEEGGSAEESAETEESKIAAETIKTVETEKNPPEPENAGVRAAREPEGRTPLNDARFEAVTRALLRCGAASVADLGCGEGRLLARLAAERAFTRLVGMDVSIQALDRATDRLHLDRAPETARGRISLLHGSLTYRDKRFKGFDALCATEVIEHIDGGRLRAFEDAVFGFASPRTVIITTPNAEYNKNYARLDAGALRHPDHRFEWTRAQFGEWAKSVCVRFGYAAEFSGIGEYNADIGAPTQMAVFTKIAPVREEVRAL